ncbi:hypothetical protein [Fluoribacter dumoffii]|uniref:DUF4209 domain-containing protein n=1 Tax=Fluoribacter dumoffii TaxID=463 RepID=A0A377G7X2_9GAMM|nr:hypothetical protein [Fluoribacter dumoffii]KTC89482.1 hypothetical protein Ldum_0550 [Fluoribacter dumoffii NY 23]STO20591.1 Uncharacterised protein [Fluoribacter dumoffii]
MDNTKALPLFKSALEDYIKQNQKITDEITKKLRKLTQCPDITELFVKQTQVEKFTKNIINQNQSMADAITYTIWPYFLKRGWFISAKYLYFQQVMRFKKAIANLPSLEDNDYFEKELEIEESLLTFTRSLVGSIEEDVCSKWVPRKEIIQQAFIAHKEGKYALSIPVLLAQSDGICHDIFGCHLFTKFEGNIKEKVKILDKNRTPLSSAFLKLLTNQLSLSEYTRDLNEKRENDPFYGPLNRHGILHGLDLDYPKEANSLRCISLLSYLIMINEFLN